MMSMCTVPLLTCIGCFSEACTGNCLPTHRDRYCCHNPSCIFHAPRPLPPEPSKPGTAQPTTPTSEDAADATEAEETPAATSGDSNVVCRETIIREWRMVGGGDGALVTGQTAAAAPATTSSLTQPATANTAPAANAPPGAHVDRPSTPPARFTIEEYEAQERLLAQYQQPQGQQPQRGRGNARAGRNDSGRGARTRTGVRFQFD